MPLTSYTEMFTRKSREGRTFTKILVSAPAGLGKTTFVAKIAYDWATGVEGSPLKDISLLFVLNMRHISHTTDLEDAINAQIFPEDTQISRRELERLIKRYERSTTVILDAVDESVRHLYSHPDNCGTIVKLLQGKRFLSCRLLVTTRPWRISEITRECNVFAHFEIIGFNHDDINEYLNKYFDQDVGLKNSLIKYMKQNPLIAEIVSVPLMALLVCVYWKEIEEKKFPNRIGQLYSAIINIMHHHFTRKQSLLPPTPETEGVIQHLVCRMGKMALKGFWPPENRIVFTSEDISSATDVEKACEIGLISKEESRPSVISFRRQTTLTFFHKTCGEKCAGDYMASLADENPNVLVSKLRQLKTIADALSVEFILQFACHANHKAADVIMKRLLNIFKSQIGELKAKLFVTEEIDFDETITIQQYYDICLRCNYEANCKNAFSHLLNNFFPEGKIYFFGISALTSVALGYYLAHPRSGCIRKIKLRPTTNADEPMPSISGVLNRLRANVLFGIKNIPLQEMHNICTEYIRKRPNMAASYKCQLSVMPAFMLINIQMWQACEHLPTAQESNIAPILASLQDTNLEELNIDGFQIGTTNIDQLLSTIQEGKLMHLLRLHVRSIGMNELQMQRLATGMKAMPDLILLDISYNKLQNCLTILSKSLPTMQSLQILSICEVSMSEYDMVKFAKNFSQFGSRLVELEMTGNPMNDRVASQLTKHLPIGKKLQALRIAVSGLSREYHNMLLPTLRHLCRLQELEIHQSQYTDDLMMSVADVMPSLPDLYDLMLTAFSTTTPQRVNSRTWQHFKAELQKKSKLKSLSLLHITFQEDDFTDLVLLCRTLEYKILW